MIREIAGFPFELVGGLQFREDTDGRAFEYTHRLSPNVIPNRYAAGPFCQFDLPEAPQVSGVYALMVADEVKYIGECEDLQSRFGPGGYGQISARNCHSDGRSTNCKVNSFVLKLHKKGGLIRVWFWPSLAERRSVEARLISELGPPWNSVRHKRSGTSIPEFTRTNTRQATGKDRFAVALREELSRGEKAGLHSLRIRSGDLHRRVGGYPGFSHRMPQCCRAMRDAMMEGDRIIKSPPKGAGANLVIEYQLPRGLGV